ncbi:YidC/Oxa1 family membrane protein insertase [Paenactinomyces guangxiensis]|uniref:Membrane protein insertase YidC n=1 Tax=Paenactinomyces guangxiensis TaxID=1490290 RepID=A0A7W1WT73_9BACL|nr:YidC/Oxa1 family membrane protein insertase [Paenactinomyces guangxiensis]MBA4495537.1 membrane protein insertase YidC [Paenactinomyces guangxiensis]MBH8592795.1 membrane protein insertase YidC [Paenactinomyces guangxiensis]
MDNFFQTLSHYFQPVFTGLEHWVGDWGIAVILFTILVRICLIPISVRQSHLAANQFVFSRKAAELQKTWTGTREALAEETPKLMRKHKFNPFAMFLNVLIQSPVLITVYATFSHLGPTAHSVLVPWVSSIGLPDPWVIVPIAIAVANGCTAMVTLIPADLMQSGSTKFSFVLMAGISLFILWSAPVATALYYGTSSLWGALERKILRRHVRRRILKHWNPETADT